MSIINAVYFSPTGGTKKSVSLVARKLGAELSSDIKDIDLTLPDARKRMYSFGSDDILVIGVPVYYGRVPAPMDGTFASIRGDNTPAVIVAVYGNRDYDDALLEMKTILSGKGFKVVAAAALIAEHTYSMKLGLGRPDAADEKEVDAFVPKAAEKIKTVLSGGDVDEITVKGNFPYKDRSPAPKMPTTNESCTDCMICAMSCPTGTISFNNPREIVFNGCILCLACVKSCPFGARVCDMAEAAAWLEKNFSKRREPEFFV